MFFDHRTTTSSPASTVLTNDTLDRTRDAATAEPLIRIRPFPETDGIAAGPRFLRGLHRVPASTLRRGAAPVYAAEIWFADGKLQFYLRAPDLQDAIALVNAHYPNSDTEKIADAGFPDVPPGDHVAGCHLNLQQDAAFPLKHLDSNPALDNDPYRTVLSRLIGSDDETIILQIVFMPVSQSWTRRGFLGRFGSGDVANIAQARRQGQVEGYLHPEVVQSKQDTRAADDIAAQVGRPAFATTIRAFAIAPDPSTAEHRLTGVADAFTELDHEQTNQRLSPTYVVSSHLPAVLEAAGMRALTPNGRLRRALRGRTNVLTVNELAGLVHLPNEEIENPNVDWSRTSAGVGVPADTPTFSASVSNTESGRPDAQSQASPADSNHTRADAEQYEQTTSGPSLDGRQAGDGGDDGV